LYRAFYGLKDYPFRLTPDPAYIYFADQHREAFSGLVCSISSRPGLAVLLGEAGTGKTTLLYTLAGLLEKRNFILARCNNPTLSKEEFFDLLLAELGVECSSSLKTRQLRALEQALMRYRDAGRPAVLIVDEAQRLPMELLEEIRLLLNLETPREKLLQIIMAGQPELEDVLRRPELRQFKQRLSAICRLEPLSIEGVSEYLEYRLAMAGLPKQTLFSGEVIGLVYRYTEGIPRLVNCLCDAAMLAGFALQSPQITAAIIDEAACDLQLSGSVVGTNGRGLPKTETVKALAPNCAAPDPSHSLYQLNGDSKVNGRVPLQSYAQRPKSYGFFGKFLELWK